MRRLGPYRPSSVTVSFGSPDSYPPHREAETALREGLPDFLESARKSPVFSFVDSDLTFTKPEVRLTIDRDKVQALGVSTLDIAQTLQASLSGQRFGYFIYDGRQYDVIGQLTRDFRSRPQDLANIAVPTPTGGMVRLDNVVTIAESSAPPELFRYNRYSAATVSGTLAPGRTMDEGIAAFNEVARATLDDRYTTSLSGAAREFVDSAASLLWVFGLALVLIYLVLAAQFESFLDPLLILLTVPLAIGGALATGASEFTVVVHTLVATMLALAGMMMGLCGCGSNNPAPLAYEPRVKEVRSGTSGEGNGGGAAPDWAWF